MILELELKGRNGRRARLLAIWMFVSTEREASYTVVSAKSWAARSASWSTWAAAARRSCADRGAAVVRLARSQDLPPPGASQARTQSLERGRSPSGESGSTRDEMRT